MGVINASAASGIYYSVKGRASYCGFKDYKTNKVMKFTGTQSRFNVDAHLIYVFGKGRADFYLNGKKLKGVATETAPPHGANVGVGSIYNQEKGKFILGNSFGGKIYHYAVYNKALTPAEISENYEAYKGA